MADDSRAADPLAVLTTHPCPFADLGVDLVKSLLPMMPRQDFAVGDHLIRQGEPGDHMLVILSGSAEAAIWHADRHTSVGRFRSGDVVGEISPLTGEPRTADVVASTPVQALRLSTDDFRKASTANPEMRVLLTNVLADRFGRAAYDGLGGKDLHGYRVGRCVGRGGTGIVYEATRAATGETVALKMLNHRLLYQPGAIQRFRQEAETLKALRHDAIARLYECFAAYGTHFLVMEFCEGATLKDLMAHRRPIAEPIVRRMVGQLAGALQALHQIGLIHRDVKPSNVMIGPTGLVKLLDFGLVKTDASWPDGTGSNARTVSQSGTFHGTPRYMAPEQFQYGPIDYRVDVYGLACVAFEALAGRPVVEASDLFGIVEEKIRFALPPAADIGRGISDEMHEFLTKGLDTSPRNRTVRLETLAAWAGPVEMPAPPASLPPDAPTPSPQDATGDGQAR
jgi:serine/threonine protein kinase